jgi:membrane protein DedA with SNARE-associated domain
MLERPYQLAALAILLATGALISAGVLAVWYVFTGLFLAAMVGVIGQRRGNRAQG